MRSTQPKLTFVTGFDAAAALPDNSLFCSRGISYDWETCCEERRDNGETSCEIERIVLSRVPAISGMCSCLCSNWSVNCRVRLNNSDICVGCSNSIFRVIWVNCSVYLTMSDWCYYLLCVSINYCCRCNFVSLSCIHCQPLQLQPVIWYLVIIRLGSNVSLANVLHVRSPVNAGIWVFMVLFVWSSDVGLCVLSCFVLMVGKFRKNLDFGLSHCLIKQASPAVAIKPARRESMPKIAPIRRAYNVVANNTGLSSLVELLLRPNPKSTKSREIL